MKQANTKNVLLANECSELILTLMRRFEQNMDRHRNLDWSHLQQRLEAQPDKLRSLNEMERTGGEPDAIVYDKKSNDLIGMKFVALNAGQNWKFTEAFSLSVPYQSQPELDTIREQLITDGGREVMCSWLQDKFGMFWQIVPAQLENWLNSNEPAGLQRMLKHYGQ